MLKITSSRLLIPVLVGGLLFGSHSVLLPRAVAAPVASAPVGVVDVTRQVAALMRDNAVEVKSDTALAGEDPARKTVKKLVVIYTLGGQRNAVAAMEGETLKIAAPAGQTLKIEKAVYGFLAYPIVDVTEKLRAGIKAGSLAATVDTKLAGFVAGQPARDPAPGQDKSLRVDYTVGGKAHSVTIPDGANLELPALGDGDGKLVIQSASYGVTSATPNLDILLETAFPLSPVAVKTVPVKPAAMPTKTTFLAPPALQMTPIAPVKVEKRGDVLFADFGLDYFGNLQLNLPANTPAAKYTLRFGEKLDADGTIDRTPPGSVSFLETTLQTSAGQTVYVPLIPLKSGPQSAAKAIKLSDEIGNITVFRYVEIEGAPVELGAANLRQLAVHTAFDDDASSFVSSDETLNAVWDLCKHTMKATTAFGVYVDGERERLPYEADAYINMLSHFAVDLNPEVARYSLEYLLDHPTWPTEWSSHMPMMAAQELRATGDTALAARNYKALVGKLMMDKTRADGLLRASAIVDWPTSERDNYNNGVADPDKKQQVGPMINTVANAFYYHSLREMEFIARELGKTAEAADFKARADAVYAAFNATFFDAERGLYIDGEGSNHAAIHANLFPLAFGLVPAERQSKVADFVQSKGMAVSVYGAQYLLEALYHSGRDDAALALMTSRDKRSWFNMIRGGSTMTWEAWDAQFKPNLTWNHAWGAAPGNIIARYVVGVQPLSPGYDTISIAPRPGTLASFDAKIPTARGPVKVSYNKETLRLQVEVPAGATARVTVPPELNNAGKTLLLDGKKLAAGAANEPLPFYQVEAGTHIFSAEAAK